MARWLWVFGALLLACETLSDRPPEVIVEPPTSFGGSPSIDPGSRSGKCESRFSPQPVLSHQAVRDGRPIPRTFYSWTTREQIEELRRDRKLFTRSETGMNTGRGYAFQEISRIAATFASTPSGIFAGSLSGELFAKNRYAWPNTWATRRAWLGEEEGDQLIQVDLKPTAWIAKVQHELVEIYDLEGRSVRSSDWETERERVGAILFVKAYADGRPICDGTFPDAPGRFAYREFILGNEAMVEQWSIGTAEMRERLVADSAVLANFLDVQRPCPGFGPGGFNAQACCAWQSRTASDTDEFLAYLNALSRPTDAYGSIGEIAATIDMLRADLFEPDPLVVRPGN